MKTAVISAMALAVLAASDMTRFDNYQPIRRDQPERQPFVPFRGNVDLLGKSHGKGASKRKRQRT